MKFATRAAAYLFFILIFCNADVLSQISSNAFEITVGTGKVVRNYPNFPELKKQAINVGLNYSRHFNGYKSWHRYYNFPRMGISLNNASLGNKAVLGYCTGLTADMTFEKRIGKSWFWAPRLEIGIGYFSKPYNEQSNPDNVIIGSAITFFAGAELLVGKKVSDKIDLVAKLQILHASNAHFKLPNVGMNLPVIALGMRYNWSEKSTREIDTIRPVTHSKIRLHTRIALGVNESGSSTGPVNGLKYPIYLASVYVSKMLSPVNKLTVGVEGWYNKGVYDFIVSQEFYDSDRQQKSCAAAIILGHEFLMGHFGLLATGGIYFYNPFYKDRLKQNEINGFKDKLKSYIPARIGVQYYLKNAIVTEKNNLFIGIYIKTNFGQADFLESGIGYMF